MALRVERFRGSGKSTWKLPKILQSTWTSTPAERSPLPPAPTLADMLFVVAWSNVRDQYHQQAVAISEEFDGKPLIVTQPVLLEIGMPSHAQVGGNSGD